MSCRPESGRFIYLGMAVILERKKKFTTRNGEKDTGRNSHAEGNTDRQKLP